MASLASVSPGASYPGLIKTLDNAALTSCVQLSDGDGNALPISINPSNSSINFGSTSNIPLGLFSMTTGSSNCVLAPYSGVYATCNSSIINTGGTNHFIGGGRFHTVNACCQGVIIGGQSNFVQSGRRGMILGGVSNITNCSSSTVIGSSASCSFSGYSLVGGAFCSLSQGGFQGANIGGCLNTNNGNASVIVGGLSNSNSSFSGIFSARNSTVSAVYSTVIGGVCNSVTTQSSSILGGCCNNAQGTFSSVVGGALNCAIGTNSAILGGQSNSATCPFSMVAGCGITSSMACAFHANRIVVTQLPNSSSGLPSGALYYDPADGNTVKYVP